MSCCASFTNQRFRDALELDGWWGWVQKSSAGSALVAGFNKRGVVAKDARTGRLANFGGRNEKRRLKSVKFYVHEALFWSCFRPLPRCFPFLSLFLQTFMRRALALTALPISANSRRALEPTMPAKTSPVVTPMLQPMSKSASRRQMDAAA